MNLPNIAYVGAGVLIGAGVVFYQTDIPKDHACETYKVVAKPVTAYVLKPPHVEPTVIYKACPQVTEKVEPAKVEEPVIEEEKPRRRHRRHHRVRKYWR